MAKKTSNYQQQKEATDNGQRKEKVEEPKYSDGEKQGKDGKTYNFRSNSTRAKIETKKRGKEDNTSSKLAQEENSDISNRDVYAIDLLKQEKNVGYALDGFITNVKKLQRKEYLKNTHIKHTTSVKNTGNRSN